MRRRLSLRIQLVILNFFQWYYRPKPRAHTHTHTKFSGDSLFVINLNDTVRAVLNVFAMTEDVGVDVQLSGTGEACTAAASSTGQFDR